MQMEDLLYIRKRQPCLWIRKFLTVAIILSVLHVCPSMSQSISGIVKGKGEGGLMGANVVATKEGNKTVAYAITDENGQFNLRIPDGAKPQQVTVSYLGFQTKTIPFAQIRDGITITLEKGTFKLREVKVSSRRIKSTGDTLTYSVAGFRQKQDRSIADVIAKMPGIEVKTDGRIEFQGKPINKFYIEGLDLMGSQYGIANRNISADKVMSVQVMQNHQPVKSLRGVSFSDQAALNIVLKDDAKAVWNGAADIGLGYGDDFLYDCRLTGMCFNKKFQTLMMYKNNNTGKDIGVELLDLTSSISGSIGEDNGIVSMPVVATPYLNSERFTFNKSHLLAGNWLWRTNKDSELRLQANGLVDKNEMQSYNRTTYLTIDDLPIITEEKSLSNTRSEWKGEAKYQYNGNDTYVMGNLKGYIDFNKSIGDAMVNEDYTRLSAKPRRRSLSGQLNVSHTTKAKNVYEFNSTFAYNYMPEQLLTLNGMTEQLDLKFLTSQNALKNKLKLGKHYLNNQIGVDFWNQGIDVAFSEEESQKNTYRLLQPYWQPSLSFLFARHKLDAVVKLSYAHQSYGDSRLDELWIEPSLRWNWQLTAMSEFSANIRLDSKPLMGKGLLDTPVFTNYQSQKTNRGETSTQKVFSINISYKYSNPITGLFFNVRPIFSQTTGNIIYTSSILNGIHTLTATDKEYTTSTKGGMARVNKSFGWAKSTLGLSATYTVSEYSLAVGEDVNDARMQTLVSSVDYSLRPVRQLSIDGKSIMQLCRQQNLARQDLSAGTTTHWQHHLGLYLFPSDSWMITLKNELSTNSDPVLGTNYFCDASVSYKTTHWELSLTAANIIGTSKYETRILGNTVETYSLTQLRPREFVVKMSFDL